MILSINLPTNNPDDYFDILQPSLIHLTSLLDYCDVEFFFIFQRPWNNEQVKRAKKNILNTGFIFKMNTTVAKKKPSMTYLRNIGIMNSSNASYYMLIDDNFKFKSGTPKYFIDSGIRYSQCLEYMKCFPACGFVMCEGSLGGSIQKLEISSTQVGLFATTRGLILRNIGAHKIFGNTSHLLGGLEESIACYHIIEEGFFPAKQFNNPTINSNMAKSDGGKFIHSQEIWNQNCAKYIRNRYQDQDWNYQKRKLPKGLKKKFIENEGDKRIFKQRIFKMNF